MKTIDKIPTGKIARATRLVKTGAKVGVNYLKYYGKKMVISQDEAKEALDKDNAHDIYDGLKQLKGSSLKLAQMLSMEKNILPQAYVEKFSLSQFSVPPLSPALVLKTFRQYFGQGPNQVFDRFDSHAVSGASIGQVHLAEKDGKKLAVKIQYPGVAESISSDLAIVKPIAVKMFNIQGRGSDRYFREVEEKLLEETNYQLEVDQSQNMVEACRHIANLRFPDYYKKLSSKRIITMDWMPGRHLSEFVNEQQDSSVNNKIAQTLWDFYMFQIHNLRKVHADPHPGNFLVSDNNELVVLDFGCIKNIPDDFYNPYFELAEQDNLNNQELFERKLFELEILRADDTAQERRFFKGMFREMLSLFTLPFNTQRFDFSSKVFFTKIVELGSKYAKNSQLRNMNGNRGSAHFIYMNRTFFGLYNLMHDLKASDVIINNYLKY